MNSDDETAIYEEKRKRKSKPQWDKVSRLKIWLRVSIFLNMLLIGIGITTLYLTVFITANPGKSSLERTATYQFIVSYNATVEQSFRQTQTALPSLTPPITSSAPCLWQSQAMDDFSDAFLFRMRRAGISNATLVVEAPCGETLPTDSPKFAFHITIQVANLEDENALGDEVARVLAVLADDNYLPATTTVNVVFMASGAQKYLWGVPLEQAIEAYRNGSRGTALLDKLGDLH